MTNQELWDKADAASSLYFNFENKSLEKKKLSTKPGQMIKEVLDSSSKRKFIEANIPIMSNEDAEHDELSAIVEEANKMAEDSFRYFLTLVKFRYNYNKGKKFKGDKK